VDSVVTTGPREVGGQLGSVLPFAEAFSKAMGDVQARRAARRATRRPRSLQSRIAVLEDASGVWLALPPDRQVACRTAETTTALFAIEW